MTFIRSKIAKAVAAVLLSCCAVVLSGCGVGEGSAIEIKDGDPIRIGLIPTSAAAPVYIAQEKGYFAKRGLNVEVQIAQNAAAVAPSVLNGQLQIGFAAASPFIAAVSKGLPLAAIANSTSNSTDGSDETGLMTTPDSPIERPRDLEGKTVAVNGLAALPHIAALEVIRRDGGDPTKVTFVAMPFPDMVGALRQGRIDAAALAEPFYSLSKKAGNKEVSTLYASAFKPGSTTTLYFTARPFIKTNPELIVKFREAIAEALTEAQNNPDTVRQVLIKYGNMKPAAAKTMGLPRYQQELTPAGLDQISEVMARFGIIPKPIDAAQVIDS